MPSLGELLLNWTGRPDPMAQVRASIAGQPPAAEGTPAGGGTAPGTAAPAAPQQPAEASVYQSPSELMNLYMELQDRQARAKQINTGIGLMGASLAHPENRNGIIAAMSGQGGSVDPGGLIGGLLDFQTKTTKISQQAAQRASVPSIASKYGLDTETALYLFDTGKLDSVIAELEKPERQLATDPVTGQNYIVDLQNGTTIGDPIGTPKKPELEITEGEGGSKIVIDKTTKEPIKGRAPIVPPEGNTEFERNYQNALKERPELTREQFRRETNTTTQQTFVDASGRNVGDPPKDMTWDIGPDGKVKLDERNAPIAVPIAGTAADLAQKKAAQEIEDAKKVEQRQQSAKDQTADVVTTEIDRAMGIIDENKDDWLPATGYGGLTAQVPFTPAFRVEEMLKTVRANIGFDKLQAMRAASPTGAALGPVSDFENELLQSTFGNLKLTQHPDDVRYNLKRIKRIYKGVVDGEFINKDGTPNQAAINEAYKDVNKDIPLDDLLKMYDREEQ